MINTFKAFLSTALTAGGSETTISLDRITTLTGETVTTSHFSTLGRGILTVNPDGDGQTSYPEWISFTAVSGTTVTGASRGLSALGNSTVSANKRYHPIGTPVVISFGVHNMLDLISYVQNAVVGQIGTASNTVAGSTKLSVAAASAPNPIAVGDNDPRVLTTEQVSFITQLIAGIPGQIVDYAGSSVPTGWLECDGSAVSRTTYASLFTAISTTWGAGNGSTTFNLPDLRNRTTIGAGTATKVATFVSRASNVITVSGISDAANNEFQTGQAVLYTAASGAMTGLTHNTTYYLVRTGNLTFSLASSLANAQNGTVLSLSSDGTGTQTFTLTMTARTLGHTGGEENHAMSSSELLAHTHDVNKGIAGGEIPAASPTGGNVLSLKSGSTGGNAAMNNMQPFAVIKKIIKY